MFEQVQPCAADPMLGLIQAYQADSSPDKINLGVGIYQDEQGHSPVLAAVKAAEAHLLHSERSKAYIGGAGDPSFCVQARCLLFNADHPAMQEGRMQTLQTAGGCAALRLAADCLAQTTPGARVWISCPAWLNYRNLFHGASLVIKDYPYYDAQQHDIDFPAMLQTLATQTHPGDMLVLQVGCHNPTGADLTRDQWQALAMLAKEKHLLVLADIAYQGFARGIQEDAAVLQVFLEQDCECFIAQSFSKNFALYNERVGALTVVAQTKAQAVNVRDRLIQCARANYSMPPHHGAAVVSVILSDSALRKQWTHELTGMRERIIRMRQQFVTSIGAVQDYHHVTQHNGLFSLLHVTEAQVARMAAEHHVYMVKDGRINFAGLNEHNMARFCQALQEVILT